MQQVLAKLLGGGALNEAEAEGAIDLILKGEANESQVGAMLALLAWRGPTLDEVVGGARAMRAKATAVPIPPDSPIRDSLIDTCGTGGAAKTFNISTVSAIVAAGARGPGGSRVYVAKHGGRSRSGRGSAEVLASLGVNVDASPASQARCLEEAGVCFSFAVNHHPAMKFAAGPRKSLGFPTIFNLFGPLCNPAGARRQVMGVYEERFVPLIAEALRRLGAERAMVVHGADGMDEITTTAETVIGHVEPGGVAIERFDARSIGVARAITKDLEAATLDEAAGLVRRVLAGERGPARDIVCVNAAAALVVGGAAGTMREGFMLAEESIDAGRAAGSMEALVRLSNQVV